MEFGYKDGVYSVIFENILLAEMAWLHGITDTQNAH